MLPAGTPLAGFPRPSLLALGGVVAGMFLGAWVAADTITTGIGAIMCALVLWALRKQWPSTTPVAIICLFLALGLAMQAPQERARDDMREALLRIDTWPQGARHVEGRIGGEVRRSRDGGVWFLLAPGARVSLAGKAETLAGPVLVAISGGDDIAVDAADLAPGDYVLLLGRIVPVDWRHDARSFDAWIDSQGAAATVRVRSVERIDMSRRSLLGSARHGMARVADRIEHTLHANLPDDLAGVAGAMLLGRTANLERDQRDDFARAGLAHLFAVSGLHAGLAGLMCVGIATLLGLGARARLAFLIAGLVLFCLLTGLRTSALRASVMLAVVFMQPLLRRPGDPLASLATVGIVLLMLRPRALWQIDFQLSFLCIGALVLCSPGALRIEEVLGRRLGHGVWSAIIVRMTQVAFLSFAIQLATAPLLASRMGTVSLISPLANMIVLPGIVIVAGTLVIALIASALFGGAGAMLFAPASWLLGLFEWIARFAGQLPFAAVENAAPWPAWLITAWFILLLLPGWTCHRRRHSAFEGIPRASFGVFGAGAVLAVWLLLPGRPPLLAVTFLDVGQGDAVLVETRRGGVMLFDTGPPSGVVLVRELRQRGVSRIDTLVLSHADADHIGGAGEVLRHFPVGRIVVGGSEADTQTWARLIGEVADSRVPVASVQRGASWSMGGDAEITVLHPTAAFTREGADRNDASVVLRIEAGRVRFLLTGDAEAAAEVEMFRELGEEALRADVMQAGHHGAATSTGPVLLAAVRPRWVVASSGRDNRYGHPRPEVIERVTATGAGFLRTDLHGAVRFETDGATLRVAIAMGHLPHPRPSGGISP